MKRALILASLAAVTASATLTPLTAQVSDQTASLAPPKVASEGGGVVDIWLNATPVFTDAATHDWIGGGIGDVVGGHEADVEALDSGTRWQRQLANKPGMSDALKKEGLDSANAMKTEAEGVKKQAGMLQKLGKVLDIIDVVSTTAKASAYATEGDYTGATKVIVGEMTKKFIEGVGMAGLSWVPGGQLWGAMLGEKTYETQVEPILDERENAVRNAEYAARYLNKPWLSPNTIMDETGAVRSLDSDMYVEKGTGLIKRRSPEDQASFEENAHTKWLDAQRWNGYMQDLQSGKITPARYDELRANYRGRDPSQPWDPTKPQLLGAMRFAGTYSGRFSGGGAGSIHFTVEGTSVSGTLSGVCTTSPCQGDPVSGSFHGTISDLGMIQTNLAGRFDISDNLIGPVTFSGELSGAALGKSAGGTWVGHNKYGSPKGSWNATR